MMIRIKDWIMKNDTAYLVEAIKTTKNKLTN